MSVRAEIVLRAEGLADGQTVRGDCPACGRKSTFTITRDGPSVVWNCYSTHCDCRGGSGGLRENLLRNKPDVKKKSDINPFKGQLEELSDSQKAYLEDKVGFRAEHYVRCNVRYAPVEDRYAYPIMRANGTRRGFVLRAYGADQPRWKALTFLDVAEPHLSWYGLDRSGPILIVEDIPSAVRASLFRTSVALCGGSVGPDAVRELREHADRVVWALDADATATAIRLHRLYGLVFSESSVLPLKQDLKNCTDDEIKEVLKCVS